MCQVLQPLGQPPSILLGKLLPLFCGSLSPSADWNNNACLSEHFRAFYFDVQYKFAVLGHTKHHYKPY